MFYKASDKELVVARDNIVIDNCIPILLKKGYVKSPFSSHGFGRDSLGGSTYNFVKLKESVLETIEIQIVKGDKWIKTIFNAIEISPKINSVSQLENIDGINFKTPPISLTEMRLITDSFHGVPLFNYRFMFKNHKLKSYISQNGLKRRIRQLIKLIESDLRNLDYYVNVWYKNNKCFKTNIHGELIGLKSLTTNERLHLIGYTEEFEKCLNNNKARARHILEWVKVDKISIDNILKETKS